VGFVEELGSIPFIRDVAKKTDSTKYAIRFLLNLVYQFISNNVFGVGVRS
jgi:hypothetical protein